MEGLEKAKEDNNAKPRKKVLVRGKVLDGLKSRSSTQQGYVKPTSKPMPKASLCEACDQYGATGKIDNIKVCHRKSCKDEVHAWIWGEEKRA